MDIRNWAQEAYQLRLGSILGNIVLSRAVNVMGLQRFYGKGAGLRTAHGQISKWYTYRRKLLCNFYSIHASYKRGRGPRVVDPCTRWLSVVTDLPSVSRGLLTFVSQAFSVRHKVCPTLKVNAHIRCRAHAVLRLRRFASDFSRTRHSTAGTRHGMCELTSAVSWRPMGDLPRFGFFRLPRGVSWLVVWIFPATRGHSQRTRHCRRTAGAQRGMCELAKRHGRDTAWYVWISFN
jgi:hypothetical protein